MDRKKTILIAVMINMGLLVLLFFAAVHQNDDLPRGIEISKPVQEPQNKPLFGEEIDLALKPLPPASQHVKPADSIAAPLQPLIPPAMPEAPDVVHRLPPLVQEPKPEHSPAPPAVVPAPIPAPATAPTVSTAIEVTVKKGDTLEKIAKAHHASIDEIIKINRLPSSFLRVGQTLKIPHSAVAQKPKPAAPKVLDGQAEYYTVKVGDNPWTIAMKNNLKVEELLKLNSMNEEKARRLKPGDRLRIR